MSERKSSESGIGFFGLLAIVFITLKLVGVIDWSWWWVLLPIYGPIVAVLAILAVCLAAYATVAGVVAVLAIITGKK